MAEAAKRQRHSGEIEELLYPSEAADMLGVHPKTLTRWARSGRIGVVVTLGGHRRYRLSEVQEILDRARVERREDG